MERKNERKYVKRDIRDNMIKGIYEKPTANNILNSERPKAFSLG